MDRDFFIKKIAKIAIENYEKYRILPSLTIAQACKESRFGTCALSPYFNFFGMKWTKTCGTKYKEFRTREQKADGTYIVIKARFRAFDNFEEGIKGYYKFLTGYKRYRNLIGETNAEKACEKIHLDGWATSLTYSYSLYHDYILKYDLLKYDAMALGKEVEKSKDIYYVVKKGDSLWRIASKKLGSGARWPEIVELNNLPSTIIHPGERLLIMKGE